MRTTIGLGWVTAMLVAGAVGAETLEAGPVLDARGERWIQPDELLAFHARIGSPERAALRDLIDDRRRWNDLPRAAVAEVVATHNRAVAAAGLDAGQRIACEDGRLVGSHLREIRCRTFGDHARAREAAVERFRTPLHRTGPSD